MGNFWVQFAINEALTVAQAFLAGSNLNGATKAALGNFITAGQAVLAALKL
jgi:hypothetical protein